MTTSSAAKPESTEATGERNTTDGGVLARPSGTEPVVRVYAEARTEELAGQIVGAAERGE